MYIQTNRTTSERTVDLPTIGPNLFGPNEQKKCDFHDEHRTSEHANLGVRLNPSKHTSDKIDETQNANLDMLQAE